MEVLTPVLEASELLLFLCTQAWGGSAGAGLLTFTVGIRVLLLPYSARHAVEAREQRRTLQRIRPRIEQIQERHADDRMAAAVAMRELMAEEGVNPIAGAKAMMVQMPVLLLLYAAVRRSLEGLLSAGFLWVRSLAGASVGLAMIAGLAVGAAAAAGIDSEMQNARMLPLMMAAATAVVLAFIPSAYSLVALGSASVSAVQGLGVRMIVKRQEGSKKP